jgi:hypothetical protein
MIRKREGTLKLSRRALPQWGIELRKLFYENSNKPVGSEGANPLRREGGSIRDTEVPDLPPPIRGTGGGSTMSASLLLNLQVMEADLQARLPTIEDPVFKAKVEAEIAKLRAEIVRLSTALPDATG